MKAATMTSSYSDQTAACRDCQAMWDGTNPFRLALRHAAQHGHTVDTRALVHKTIHGADLR